jgi:hypothetical protein
VIRGGKLAVNALHCSPVADRRLRRRVVLHAADSLDGDAEEILRRRLVEA